MATRVLEMEPASLAVGQNKYGLDAAVLFTRGKPGEADDRGESMVQKHTAKLQQDKEVAAMQRMSMLVPQLGEATRMLALQETDWIVEQALVVAKQFMEANASKLEALQKARKKAVADAATAAQGGKGKAGGSGSDSGSDSDGSGSDSDRGKKRKHSSKSSKHSKSKHSKKHKSSSSQKDGKDKKRGKDKEKEKEARPKEGTGAAKSLTHSENFGRFGIIRELDRAVKSSEFTRWAMDIKKTSLETCGPTEERELFKMFMEDFNTGTMPHRKYYNMELYEREKAAKAARKQAKTGVKVSERQPSALEDMEEMRRQRMVERARVESERLADAYKDLKYNGKAHDMREQELLRAQMALAYKTGDAGTAKALAKRLEPAVIDDRIPKKR